MSRRTILLISQVYVPDPASVGQHMADAAAELARRGWRVRVLCSARGYDDPRRRYPARETVDGVDVRRLPLASFGKRSMALRLLGALCFLAQATVRGLFVRDLAAVFVTTSPPMASVAALVVGALRRVPIKYWVMDLNPDQMVELRRIGAHSLPARAFDLLNRLILDRAGDVVALDRFMAGRLQRKRDIGARLTVLPPWPPEDADAEIPHAENPFRDEHRLDGRFVVMYSGNHALSMPLDALLGAAQRLADEPRLTFLFVGGGAGKRAVEEAIQGGTGGDVRSLPYEPLARVRFSLSAADLHVVVVGEPLVGVVHPCKIYGAMAVGRPILLIGPEASPAAEIVREHGIGWRVSPHDAEGAAATLRAILALPEETLAAMGRRAREVSLRRYSKRVLCTRLCDVVERGVA